MTITYKDHLQRVKNQLELHVQKIVEKQSNNIPPTEDDDIQITVNGVQFDLFMTSSLYESLSTAIDQQIEEWGDVSHLDVEPETILN